ncbi:MAG: hypothetical protein IPI68_09370 [Chitinophagaceae bacterium]|nr:hypothetical protein [Chitinophagaceae bacterium]
MVDRISTAVKEAAPNAVFVSGHEHNLQHLKDSNFNYIISGGGCKDSRASSGKKSLLFLLIWFSVMEVSKNKNVTITFYTVLDTVKKAYTATLFNFSTMPVSAIDSASAVIVDDPFLKYKDTVTIAASNNFPPVSGMKNSLWDKITGLNGQPRSI